MGKRELVVLFSLSPWYFVVVVWHLPHGATGLSEGAQWLSGRVLDSRPRGRGFEPHRRHCLVSLSKDINPSLVLVQPRKTRPFITERLLMGRKKSNQTNKRVCLHFVTVVFPDHTHLLS